MPLFGDRCIFFFLPAAACTLCNGCEMRGECVRVFLWCAACCDVSSLLQHGARELGAGGGREKTTLGHYILLSGIHTARRTRRIGLGGGGGGGGRASLLVPEAFFFL